MKKTAECIAFANQKGGTGKTTSCLSIAGFLAKNNGKVLVVDFDPQASATSGLGIDKMTLRYSMYDAVLGQCEGYECVPITQAILQTDIENLHVAPSELDLSVAEVIMQHMPHRANILKTLLKDVSHIYDYMLIDTPASTGLLMINCLCAADHVVIPLDPSIFSLEAIENLKTSLFDIKRMTGHSINKITAVLIRHARKNIFSGIFHKPDPSTEVEARLREMFNPVFIVPDSVEIYEAQREGIPVSHYAPGSRAGKAYEKIAKSIQSVSKQ